MGCQGKASNDSFKLLSGLPASSDMLVRIFLFLAPERWNSDIRNASDLALLQFCAVLKLEIQKHQIPAFFSRDLSHLRIFLILAPERWNSDIRNASDFVLAWALALLQFCAVLKLEIQKHQIPAFFSPKTY